MSANLTEEELFGVLEVAAQLVVEESKPAEHDTRELVMELEEVLLLYRLGKRQIRFPSQTGRGLRSDPTE